jgi:glycosyltransferase involved in cell wall biosynthesis
MSNGIVNAINSMSKRGDGMNTTSHEPAPISISSSPGTPLRIIVVHNAYQWRGGEDTARDSEVALLREGGQSVETYDRDNAAIAAMSRIDAARQTLWSSRTTTELRARIEAYRPDLIHVHNSFPLVSPSLFWEAARAGVPVVQTLHNFRLLCPQAMFLRDNKVCEDCLGKVPWRGVLHGCYRGSVAQTAVVASMLTAHRAVGTYAGKVTRYIALNRFCRDKFIQGGLPADRFSIKPNFVAVSNHGEEARGGGLFVGRLSREKGIGVLLEALDRLNGLTIDLIGTGPMQADVLAHARAVSRGALERDEVLAAMRRASYLVLPSIWHEVMPLSVVEAFACGLPVIASRSGALAELIEDGVTGLLFTPGAADELASAISWAEAHRSAMLEMGRNARAEYLLKYTPERNYEQLMAIYRDALRCVGATGPKVPVERAA